MKTILVLFATMVVLFAVKWVYTLTFGVGEIEYRGETIRLSRRYTDYDAYKDDTENIAKEELPRVEKLIRDARIGPVFRDWTAFVDGESKIKFPGYGCGGGPKVEATGIDIVVSSVEIPSRPPAERYRYFILEKQADGSLRIIDDFVEMGYPRIALLKASRNALVYMSEDQAVVRERCL